MKRTFNNDNIFIKSRMISMWESGGNSNEKTHRIRAPVRRRRKIVEPSEDSVK